MSLSAISEFYRWDDEKNQVIKIIKPMPFLRKFKYMYIFCSSILITMYYPTHIFYREKTLLVFLTKSK